MHPWNFPSGECIPISLKINLCLLLPILAYPNLKEEEEAEERGGKENDTAFFLFEDAGFLGAWFPELL